MAETISHPAHYGGAASPHECIKVLESWLTRVKFLDRTKPAPEPAGDEEPRW